ncbi:TonB-dependent receptor [Flavobacteriaceae bacterium]|nr:TonB-dependent receptor [Flavobacteriaceae bacterium]
MLRGASSIEGSTAPLIIVDGIITEGNLNQFSSQDIKSLEVIKGAAASSLYGSLAGNGVIQIITKKGTTEKPQFKIRFENGFSNVQSNYPLAKNHDRLLDANGEFDISSGGIVADPDGLFDNPWPGQLIDNVSKFVSSQPYSQIDATLSQKLNDKASYYLSVGQTEVDGILDGLGPTTRQNIRLNLDLNVTEKLKLELNNYLVKQTGIEVTQAGQGDNTFFNLLTADPTVDLSQKDANGNFFPFFSGNGYLNEYQNPLYIVRNQEFNLENTRLVSSITGKYKFNDFLSFNSHLSTDRGVSEFTNFFPKGYISGSQGAPNTDNGFIFNVKSNFSRVNGFAQLNFDKTFGDFNVKSSLRYLHEDVQRTFSTAQSSNFLTEGVTTLQQGVDNISINSANNREKTQNVFLSGDIDWKDKIILGGLIRTDRSSLFGENNRDQIFYRGSFAYRMGEDITANWLDELKFRVSYGTAGLRPNFGDIHETFSVTQTGVRLIQTNNPNLQSPTISELELGVDLKLLNKISFSLTYANSKTKDAILTAPLPIVGVQKRNVAETAYQAFEASLLATPIDNDDFLWEVGLTYSTVNNEITSLGNVSPFNRNLNGFSNDGVQIDSNPAVNLFRVEAGQPFGAIFGNQLAASTDDLTVVDGLVINEGLNLPLSDFSVNEFGHVIVTANENQAGLVSAGGEQAIRKWDLNSNQLAVNRIGDTNPDFTAGIKNTLNYKNFSFYSLIDMQIGGDVYNYTKQFLYFNDRHGDLDNFGAAGQQSSYANGSSTIYNGAAPIDYFIEDGSFVKIREISLSYAMGKSILGTKIPVDEIKFIVSGRNLYTFTNYSGFDPEVALSGSPIYKLDEFSFPNFRTYAATIQITF